MAAAERGQTYAKMAAALASSCDSDDSDDDEIGALVYRTSRTARGLAEEEEEAATSELKTEEEEERAAAESRPLADLLPVDVDAAARTFPSSELGTTGLAEGPRARERDAKRPRIASDDDAVPSPPPLSSRLARPDETPSGELGGEGGGEGGVGDWSIATSRELEPAGIERATGSKPDDYGPEDLSRKINERLITKLNRTLEANEGERAEVSPIFDDLAGLAGEELIRKMDERLVMMLDQIGDGRVGAAPAKWRKVEESRREGVEGIVVLDGPSDPVEGKDETSCLADSMKNSRGEETAKQEKVEKKSKSPPDGFGLTVASQSPDGPGGADGGGAGPRPSRESARADGDGRRGGCPLPRSWTTLQQLFGRKDVVAPASRTRRRRRKGFVRKRDSEAEGSPPAAPPSYGDGIDPSDHRRTRRHPRGPPQFSIVDPRDPRGAGGGVSPSAPGGRWHGAGGVTPAAAAWVAGYHDEGLEFRSRREDSPDPSAHRHLRYSERVRNPSVDHGRGRRRRVENPPWHEEEARRPIEERRLEGGGRRPTAERSFGIESEHRPRAYRHPPDGPAEGAEEASLRDERFGEGFRPRPDHSPGQRRIEEGFRDFERHPRSMSHDGQMQAHRFEHEQGDVWDCHGGHWRETPDVEHRCDVWDESPTAEEFAPTRRPAKRHPAAFSHDRHDRPREFESEARHAPWEWRDETRTTSPLSHESRQDRPCEFDYEERYSPWERRDETRTTSPLSQEGRPPRHQHRRAAHPPRHDYHEQRPATHPPRHGYYHYHFHHYPPRTSPPNGPGAEDRGRPPPPSAYGPPPPMGRQAPPPRDPPQDYYRHPPPPDHYHHPPPSDDYHPQHAHPASHGAPPYHPSHPPRPDYHLPPHVVSSQGAPRPDGRAGPHDAHAYPPPPPMSSSYSR